jgi:hypothetical protein
MDAPTYISNHEKIIEEYGHWPTFHDDEVISLALERSSILFGNIHNAQIILVVYCMQMYWSSDRMRFENVRRNLIRFEFDDVSDVRLNGFNQQNAIHALEFKGPPPAGEPNGAFKVFLEPAFGLGGDFGAQRGKVVSIIPCDTDGVPI